MWINHSNRDVHLQSELLPQSNIKLRSTHINHESKPKSPNIRIPNAFNHITGQPIIHLIL